MALIVEDFEDSNFAISFSGDWEVSDFEAFSGTWSLWSGELEAEEESVATITVPDGATTFRMQYMTFFFTGDVELEVWVDGIFEDGLMSDGAWTLSPDFDVTGASTVTLTVTANPFLGRDEAFVDDLTFETADGGGPAAFFGWGIPI